MPGGGLSLSIKKINWHADMTSKHLNAVTVISNPDQRHNGRSVEAVGITELIKPTKFTKPNTQLLP